MKAKLDQIADAIRSHGGVVDTAVVDALDAIESHRRQWACELDRR
jgi:hypothetical protein